MFTISMTETVVLETSLGDVQLELYWQHAPRVSYRAKLVNVDMIADPSDMSKFR